MKIIFAIKLSSLEVASQSGFEISSHAENPAEFNIHPSSISLKKPQPSKLSKVVFI